MNKEIENWYEDNIDEVMEAYEISLIEEHGFDVGPDNIPHDDFIEECYYKWTSLYKVSGIITIQAFMTIRANNKEDAEEIFYDDAENKGYKEYLGLNWVEAEEIEE